MGVIAHLFSGITMADQQKLAGSRVRAHDYVHPNMTNAYKFAHVPSAIEIDGWVYLTGVIAAPTSEEGADLAPAFSRAFEQIGEVLEQSGCNWGDVIKFTSFHLDIDAELMTMAAVKNRYVTDAPYPAWTVIGAGSLANPKGVCEIEVIARKAVV
jgi:enamine deaminase RidA (YjgF/YER057c/UK114 family)